MKTRTKNLKLKTKNKNLLQKKLKANGMLF